MLIDQKLDRIMTMSEDTGLAVLTDGWSNARREALINYLVATPRGAKFLRSTFGDGAKDAEYMRQDLLKVLTEVGIDKVVVVVTDSAKVNQKALKLVTAEHKHITWVRCTAHAINLIFKDISKLDWALKIAKDARMVGVCVRVMTSNM